MFKTFVNAWKIQELRKKILFTALIILIFRIGSAIPVPFTNILVKGGNLVQEGSTFLNYLIMMTGDAFNYGTLFALSITPYINSSIIMQLLCVAIPPLERLAKEEDGQKKIASITRYVTVVLGIIQSVAYYFYIRSAGYLSTAADGSAYTGFAMVFQAIVIILCFTAGTALIMWLGEQINDKGIGNGVSLIIFASIVSNWSSLYTSVKGLLTQAASGKPQYYFFLPLLIVLALVAVVFVVVMTNAERRITIQYAKRVVGRKMYGGQSTFIPLKANANGVMPLIFAMTIMQVPAMIGQFWPDGGFYKFYINYMSASSEHWYGHLVYYVIYSLLIVAFAYFYTTISFNPVEISKNLQQNGGFIPGIRPGRPTGEYLKRISNRLTLFGAIFLMILAIVPTVLLGAFGLSSTFGPTSILIMVSVALETSAQLESMMLMRHYKGFLG